MRKRKNKNDKLINKFLKKLFIKIMICCVLFLVFLICTKKVDGFQDNIYKKIYYKNFSFAKINSWYEKYFGDLFPINRTDSVAVFNESLSYTKKDKYLDGVILTVKDNYLVPSISSGIIVYFGYKDNYGKTIIVEDDNGLDIWYSNINHLNINLYDYINKGDFLGEVEDNKLILVFQKDGKKEDYNKYI